MAVASTDTKQQADQSIDRMAPGQASVVVSLSKIILSIRLVPAPSPTRLSRMRSISQEEKRALTASKARLKDITNRSPTKRLSPSFGAQTAEDFDRMGNDWLLNPNRTTPDSEHGQEKRHLNRSGQGRCTTAPSRRSRPPSAPGCHCPRSCPSGEGDVKRLQGIELARDAVARRRLPWSLPRLRWLESASWPSNTAARSHCLFSPCGNHVFEYKGFMFAHREGSLVRSVRSSTSVQLVIFSSRIWRFINSFLF